MSCTRRLLDFLDDHGAMYVVISHSRAYTAQEVAASLHVPGRELAKAVVVRTEKRLALVVVRAQDHVDLARTGRVLGGLAALADESELGVLFPDCELGAMPPFGLLYGMPTLVDAAIARDREIVFNAGTHTDAVRMPYVEYARIAEPRVHELTLRAEQLVE